MSEFENNDSARKMLRSILGALAGILLIAFATFVHWVFVNGIYGYDTWQKFLIAGIGIGTATLGWKRPNYFLWLLPFFKGAFIGIGNQD